MYLAEDMIKVRDFPFEHIIHYVLKRLIPGQFVDWPSDHDFIHAVAYKLSRNSDFPGRPLAIDYNLRQALPVNLDYSDPFRLRKLREAAREAKLQRTTRLADKNELRVGPVCFVVTRFFIRDGLIWSRPRPFHLL